MQSVDLQVRGGLGVQGVRPGAEREQELRVLPFE